jgi:ion channel-forming bestrophin family protein
MYIKRRYGFLTTVSWSKWPLILGSLWALTITAFFYFTGIDIALPYQPISIIGISVAFYLGFKNNSSYDRAWEARKIWGAIVNTSRSFGMGVAAFVQGDNAKEVRKELIYRHIAWLTSLRYQLRLKKEWEHGAEVRKWVYYPEVTERYIKDLGEELAPYISKEEWDDIDGSANISTQIMATQSVRLQELKDKGYFEDFRHMELFTILKGLIEEQGKSERIKNFPFPRQYSSAALWVTIVFAVLLPFSMLDILMEEKPLAIWLNIPVSGAIIWVFFLMEMIGDYSENPFEGSYNDVPITTISRNIEIDLREMIDDEGIPPGLKPENGFLM